MFHFPGALAYILIRRIESLLHTTVMINFYCTWVTFNAIRKNFLKTFIRCRLGLWTQKRKKKEENPNREEALNNIPLAGFLRGHGRPARDEKHPAMFDNPEHSTTTTVEILPLKESRKHIRLNGIETVY